MFIPVRIQVESLGSLSDHVASGSDTAQRRAYRSKIGGQMNPRNYLHLPQSGVDIRGSKIAVVFRFKNGTRQSSALVFNFFDGRWKKIIEEPIKRFKEALSSCADSLHGCDPIYLQAAILTSTLRWWNNSINSFNDQLIAYVRLPFLIEPRCT